MHQGFFNQPFEGWIKDNAMARPPAESSPHSMVSSFLRNSMVLVEGEKPLEDSTLVDISRRALAQAQEAAGALQTETVTRRRRQILVRWTPPPEDYYKLNTDGSLNNATGNASAGGLIRDWEGNWVRGFTVNIGKTSSFAAELWGLILCKDLGLRNIHIEMDSNSIMQMLQ